MRDLQADPRFVVQFVGSIDAEAELEGTAEIRAVATPVGAHRRQRRHDEAIKGNVRVEATVAIDTALSVYEQPNGWTNVEKLFAIPELDPPLAGRHGAAMNGDVEGACRKIEIARLVAEHGLGIRCRMAHP